MFAGLGSVTLASSSAVAGMNPEPNSVQAFGSAPQLGSSSGLALHAGVIGIAADPVQHGYWLVGADGGVFAFGHAGFFGSTGSDHLNAPIVGMAASPTGRGYWLVGADGGVFAFGDARYEGSVAGVPLAAPITAIVPTTDGHGYWLVGTDGGVFAFGDARLPRLGRRSPAREPDRRCGADHHRARVLARRRRRRHLRVRRRAVLRFATRRAEPGGRYRRVAHG